MSGFIRFFKVVKDGLRVYRLLSGFKGFCRVVWGLTMCYLSGLGFRDLKDSIGFRECLNLNPKQQVFLRQHADCSGSP